MNTIKNAPLALVTGASRGIGKAIAEALAEAGYHLILTCSHTLPDLQEVAACLEEKYGITCTAMAADASEPAAIEKVFASLDHLDECRRMAACPEYEPELLLLHQPSGSASDAAEAQRTHYQYFLRLGKCGSFHGSGLLRLQGWCEQLHQSTGQGAGSQ
mgnify:CR=1 FL=1